MVKKRRFLSQKYTKYKMVFENGYYQSKCLLSAMKEIRNREIDKQLRITGWFGDEAR